MAESGAKLGLFVETTQPEITFCHIVDAENHKMVQQTTFIIQKWVQKADSFECNNRNHLPALILCHILDPERNMQLSGLTMCQNSDVFKSVAPINHPLLLILRRILSPGSYRQYRGSCARHFIHLFFCAFFCISFPLGSNHAELCS